MLEDFLIVNSFFSLSTESGKPMVIAPSYVLSNQNKRKIEETPSENIKKLKTTPTLERILNTPAVNAKPMNLISTPRNEIKSDINGLSMGSLSATKKTAKKSIRDPTPSLVEVSFC